MTFKAAAIQICSGVDPQRNAAAMARLRALSGGVAA
jgi:hypothetical protein